jgi:hypothetical protein
VKAIRIHEPGGPDVLGIENVPIPVTDPQTEELRLTIGRTLGLVQAARARQPIEGRHTVGGTVLTVGAGP